MMIGHHLQQLSALAFRSNEPAGDAKLSGAAELGRECQTRALRGALVPGSPIDGAHAVRFPHRQKLGIF